MLTLDIPALPIAPKASMIWLMVMWRSVVVVATILGAWSLDGDEHEVLIGGDKDLLVFGFNAQEWEVVGGVHVPYHAFGLFGQEGDVARIVVTCIYESVLSFLLSSKVVRTMPPL